MSGKFRPARKGEEPRTPVRGEPLLGYHPDRTGFLTHARATGLGTMSDGEFDWGGRLRKGIGGAQRSPQDGRKPSGECKGIRRLDCDTDGWGRYESRT